MNHHHPHNNIIEKKLEQLPVGDTAQLWNGMHAILDKEMPQKKERRRFIWWFFSGNGFLLLSVSLIIISSSSILFLSQKENSAVTIEKLTASQQPDKFIAGGDTKVLSESKENATTNNKPDQRTNNLMSATTASINAFDIAANNNFIKGRAVKQSKTYPDQHQFDQPIQNISGTRETFDIAPLDLESIHQGLLVATDLIQEKKLVSPQPEPMNNKMIKLNPRNNNERGLYAGIISGVDLSSIHFRSLKTGASKGFVIGYALNKKWSIESGLLWDTKRVYDNGTYFNPPGYTPTSGVTIIAVNGKSRLYELPVNMKYTITPGKHSLFATTGLSSYFMRSENYDYEYTQNNQPGGHNYLSYKNETKNWFSVVNLSIGYAHSLGDAGSIRVEPYLKLPVKNLGVANMPIMSTGLNVGFIKKIR
jgi:hypothetical protein